MKKLLSTKTAGGLLIFTGIGHTSIQTLMQIGETNNPALEKLMSETTVPIIIERSVLDYHLGFSWAMGILLIGFGAQIRQVEKSSILGLLSCLAVTIIAFIFFHPIAMALTLAASIINLYSFLRK